MENIPKYLYRGIKLNYELLHKIKLYGDDIKPHYEPLIDQFGRKTVSDGNEYGVYMTDNLIMAKQAYSKVNMMDGTNIRKDLILRISDRPTPLNIPAVGIVYKIDTYGIGVHKPWISSQLTGHYNNGFQGDEWVAEVIPSTNYIVEEAIIGPDLLHDAQKINVSNIIEAEQQIKIIVERRKEQLELLGKELEKLTPMKRMQLKNQDIQLYRDLFGDKGVRYINIDDISINTGLDYVKFLLYIFYNENTEQLNYTELLYIETLKSRLKPDDSVDKLVEIIKFDILLNQQKRQIFIDKKVQINEIANTIFFDRKQEMYNKVLNVLMTKKNNLENDNKVSKNDVLRSKVEQEHFMTTEPTKEELISLRDSLKDTKSEMLSRGFEMPSIEDIFNTEEEIENKEENVEKFGRRIK